ncbi:MAG: PilZ domain-containing protein [Acidiferrobacterales bacterium]
MNKKKPSNRRVGQRRVAEVKVMVTDDRLGLTRCKLRDISLDGAFIEAENLSLSKNANVDLVLRIRYGNKRKHCRVPATVLRVTDNGAALAFSKLDERVYRTLFDIVYPS